MKWLVASLYTFAAVVMFVSIAFVYNLGKKQVAVMTAELEERHAAEAEAAEAVTESAEA